MTLFHLPGKDHYIVSNKNVSGSIVDEDSITSVSISVVGDLMCHLAQFNYARVGKDSFDFVQVYRYVSQFLSEADVTFGNLETVTAGKSKGYSGYPLFNSPDEYIEALKATGFDMLTTSNNHCMDKGENGLSRTIDVLTNNGINYNGTFKSKSDRDSIRIYTKNDIKIAFLAYTYGTNGIPVPAKKMYLVNVIDLKQIEKDILSAKSIDCDVIIVHYHFGDEYEQEPNKYQREIVKKTIEFGADIIIGGHPHTIQPVDYFFSEKSNLDSVFVAYSLGNFFSNQRQRYTDAGLILNLVIEKNIRSNKVQLKHVNYIPTWVYKGNTGNKNEFVIFPSEYFSDSTITFLNSKDRKVMEQAYNDTKKIISKYSEIEIRNVANKTLVLE